MRLADTWELFVGARPCRAGVLNAEPGGGRAAVLRSGTALDLSYGGIRQCCARTLCAPWAALTCCGEYLNLGPFDVRPAGGRRAVDSVAHRLGSAAPWPALELCIAERPVLPLDLGDLVFA